MNALMPQIVALIERALDKPAQSLDAVQAAMDQTPGWDSLKTMGNRGGG